MKYLSVIYVYYNTPSELVDSYNSLHVDKAIKNCEIIIINNNSPLRIPESITDATIINNKINKGFGSALNRASRIAKGKYLLFLNPDTKVPPKFVSKIINKMESDNDIGLLGVKYKNTHGQSIKSVGKRLTFSRSIFSFSFLAKVFPHNKSSKEYWMTKFNYSKEQMVEVVGGACMVVRKDVFKKIKGFDEQFFMYFEEADLSLRIKQRGFKVVYFPDITITHLVGKSSSDKNWIKKIFEESRYKFLKKYEGRTKALIAEGIIRIPTPSNIIIFTIVCLSLFLNLYRISDLMMFYGDFGRDYLAARDMLLTGEIPLLGIPSSVVWLHQGPLSIYLIGAAFFISNFNPVAPAILYAALGVLSTLFTYIVGRTYFDKYVGILAAAFFATSPLVVINARMPYHTAPIPLVTLIFFLVLKKVTEGKKQYIPLLFFLFGLLFLLELSNSVLLLILLVAFLLFRPRINRKDIAKAGTGLILGILPFVIYDATNKFIQIGGFALWVLNRVRLFMGLATSNTTTSEVGNAVVSIWSELNRYIFPESRLVVIFIVVLLMISTLHNWNKLWEKKEKLLIYLWILVPVTGFLVHAKPGTAYTPVLFPGLAILLGFTFYNLIKINKIFLFPLICITTINSAVIINNNYFLATNTAQTKPELVNYGYGLSFTLREQAAAAIVNDANGKSFSLAGGGYLKEIGTGVDNYRYLVWYKGGKVKNGQDRIYRIYENRTEIKNLKKVIYQNKYIAVTKNE